MDSTFPPCFGSLAAFDAHEDQARDDIRPPGYSYCTDCTPGFQALMLKQDRCFHPETVFVELLDENGEPDLAGQRQAATVAY